MLGLKRGTVRLCSHEEEWEREAARTMRLAGYHLREDRIASQMLFAAGSYYEGTGEEQTHFVHVVLADGAEWRNYINFRNYLIKRPEVARAYEALKCSLAAAAPVDAGREKYLAGKEDFSSPSPCARHWWILISDETCISASTVP